MSKTINRDLKLVGINNIINSKAIKTLTFNGDGHILLATTEYAVSNFTLTNKFAKGCIIIKTNVTTGTSGRYENVGTTTTPVWELIKENLIVTPQALSGAGAITVTEYKTNWTTTGANAGTLADGSFTGQKKLVQLIVDGGDGTLTPSNLSGGTSITFADVGDCALLEWNGSDWVATDLYNIVDGATAPVLA